MCVVVAMVWCVSGAALVIVWWVVCMAHADTTGVGSALFLVALALLLLVPVQ